MPFTHKATLSTETPLLLVESDRARRREVNESEKMRRMRKRTGGEGSRSGFTEQPPEFSGEVRLWGK